MEIKSERVTYKFSIFGVMVSILTYELGMFLKEN